MAHHERLESRGSSHLVAGSMSVALHLVVLVAILISGGRQDGAAYDDTPVASLVFVDAAEAHRRDGAETGAWHPAALEAERHAPQEIHDVDVPSLPDPEPDVLSIDADAALQIEQHALDETIATSRVEPLATMVLPSPEMTDVVQRLEHLASRKLKSRPRAQATWNQEGKQYTAELMLERATDAVEPDRVIAEVSAETGGRRYTTLVMLKRMAFSEFSQVIDRWDPMVQLHDDEIVGRVHINSRFNILSDGEARPTVQGKVSTAASGINVRSIGRRRSSDMFREGVETRADRISLEVAVDPIAWAERDADARVHQLAGDTRIRFFADGSYGWGDSRLDTPQHRAEADDGSVYFIAASGATLYVQGVVAGRYLVYSPQRIVVEDSLTYAHDPRVEPESDDYMGLVCDRNIEIARPEVTGPGDVDVHAALFARRRFVVTDIDHRGPAATLRILGSLAAGSVTASEPRYATKVVYDERFERTRPPGFPSADRFGIDHWDGRWTEVMEPTTAAKAY